MSAALWYHQSVSKIEPDLADWTVRQVAKRKPGRPRKADTQRKERMNMERVQRTVTDLSTLEDVTLVKEFEYTPVTSTEEALAKLENNAEKLLAVINDGLRAEIRRNIAGMPDGWHNLTDEGEVGDAFSGQVADSNKVNALVLTLAKTVFGYSKDMTADQKKASKQSAMGMIKSTQAIRDGLAKSAALSPAE